jgi:hypothetical protein
LSRGASTRWGQSLNHKIRIACVLYLEFMNNLGPLGNRAEVVGF